MHGSHRHRGPAHRQPSAHHQNGAALIISLILLMVLTVLAVSTMRTASLELLMAGNAQYRENAFRIAQNGVDAVVRRAPGPVDVDCPAPTADPAVNVPELGGRYITAVCYRGRSIAPGYSVPIPIDNYEVTSTGTTNQRDAQARLVQGFAVLGVSGP